MESEKITFTEEELTVAAQQEQIAALQAQNANLISRATTLRALVNRMTTENAKEDEGQNDG